MSFLNNIFRRDLASSHRHVIVFLFFFALIFARLLYQASYYPAYFASEEVSSLDNCAYASQRVAHGDAWYHFLLERVTQYDKGYSWVMWPFYGVFGYDTRLIVYLICGFCAGFCALFFSILRISMPGKSTWVNVLVVTSISVFILCVRRYKWHTISYLSVCSIYLYFLPYWAQLTVYKIRLRVAAVMLFLLSLFFYFGNIIYAPPFILLFVAAHPALDWRRKLLWSSGGAALALFVGISAYNLNEVFADRIIIGYEGIVQLGEPAFVLEKRAQVDYFIRYMLSRPVQILFILGFVLSVCRVFRRDHIALTHLVLLGWALFVHSALQGLHNPDGLNWAMLPLLAICIAGADQIFIWFRDKIKYGYVIYLGLAAWFIWNEGNFYPQLNRDAAYQQAVWPYDTKAQSALILRHIKETNDSSARYFMPAPSVPVEQGGFDYAPNLERVEYADVVARIVFFTDPEDLSHKLETEAGAKTKIVFLSVLESPESDTKDFSSPLLPGELPRLIYPYASFYGIKFPVRMYKF